MSVLESLLKNTTFDTKADCVRQARRVAAIEVGSRAVRLVVLDVSKELHIKVLCSRGKEIYLSSFVEKGGAALEEKCKEIREITDKFIERAKEKNVARIEVFGTEAIRRIQQLQPELLAKYFPGMIVLDKRAEAFCSFIAAAKSLPWVAPTGEDIFVIDQGGGSMELALGRRTNDCIELKEYKSYRIGTHDLVELLHAEKDDVGRFVDALHTKVSDLRGIEGIDAKTRVVTLGSAATRMAWFTVRERTGGTYGTTKVHGKVIEVIGMDRLIKKAVADKERAKRYVGFNKNSMEEFSQFITGIAGLCAFLQKAHKKRTVVSGWGTRYGFAILLSASEGYAECARGEG